MADYYHQKRQAFIEIDKMLENGDSFDTIVYKISTRYGFGELVVKKRIAILENLKFVLTKDKPKDEPNPEIVKEADDLFKSLTEGEPIK